MSYNEEGLIKVKRGSCASKKCPDYEEERVELQPTPLSTTTTPPSPPAQVLEERTRNIILEEMPWILPGSSELGSRISRPTGLTHLLGDICCASAFSNEDCEFIVDLTGSIPEPPIGTISMGYCAYNPLPISYRIDGLITRIINASMRSIKSLTEGNLTEYRINAAQLQSEFNDLNRIQQKAIDRYDARLNIALEVAFNDYSRYGGGYNDEMTAEEFKIRLTQDANKYKAPLGEDTYLIQFLFLVHRVIRTLEVEYAIRELLHNTMPILRSELNFDFDTANIIRGMLLTDLTSALHSDLSHSGRLIPYQIYMESVYKNLLESLNKLHYDNGKIIIFTHGEPHGPYSNFVLKTPIGGDFLSYLRNTIQEHHDRLEGAIARSREKSDAMCVQLEEYDEQVISIEELRAEIDTILSEYRESTLNPIEKEFGADSSQYREAIQERNALQQIIRDLNSQDEVRIQQAISNAEQNKTVQQMLADKKLILITPTCKPFKDSHDKKDDDGNSDDAGNGRNNPGSGPSGESASSPASQNERFLQLQSGANEVIEAMEGAKDDMGKALSANIHFENAKANYEHFSKLSEIGLAILFWPQYVIRSGVAWSSYREAARSGDATLSATNAKLINLFNKIDNVVRLVTQIEQENTSQDVLTSVKKIKALEEVQKLFDLVKYIDDHQAYDYVQDGVARDAARQEVNNLKTLLSKINTIIDREIDSYAHLHNSIIQTISHAATDIVTNTKKYHLAEADVAMKAGNLEDARKHAESAKESIHYDFSLKGVQSYNEGDWKNITLESLQQYSKEKLDIAKASSEEWKFFMQVYTRIMNKYTQTLREEDASCKDCVLKIVTKSKLTDIKTDLDTALEELNGIETEKSNAQEIHDLLTRTLQEEHALIRGVSDYAFGKVLPTLDAYSVIFGTEKNLCDSVDLSKLPSLSKHFSINPEQLRTDIDKTFADVTKVAGIDTQVNALKCGCIAMNNALTGDGQNSAQYLGETLKSRAEYPFRGVV